MAKIRERTVKQAVWSCFDCEYIHQGEGPEHTELIHLATLVSTGKMAWTKDEMLQLVHHSWECPDCGGLDEEAFEVFAPGETAFECVECGLYYHDEEEARLCC